MHEPGSFRAHTPTFFLSPAEGPDVRSRNLGITFLLDSSSSSSPSRTACVAALVTFVEPGSSVRKTSWYCFNSCVILRLALNCCHADVHFFKSSKVGFALISKGLSPSDSSESPIMITREDGYFEGRPENWNTRITFENCRVSSNVSQFVHPGKHY